MSAALVIRNAELHGERADVSVRGDRIAAIGASLPRGEIEINARGGALIPGLIDHHIHLFATAARLESVDLDGAQTRDALLSALRAAPTRARDIWIRAVDYDDSRIGLISRDDLDAAHLPNPIRVQDRTGALWVLNTPALERVLEGAPPPCVERAADGRPTGRIWRGDAWLRTRIASTPPSLAALSRQLAAYGVTGVTDTSATNGAEEAALLAEARARGELKQSLCVMSAGAIPPSPHYDIGAIKILPDERDLPDIADLAAHMQRARALSRRIAVHCVTAAELAVTLAAFEAVGALPGDRLEHGGVIPPGFLSDIRAFGLTIVTQPNFIHDRGDRYGREMAEEELPDLYRLASLRAAGIAVAAGSDAPYGRLDPWRAIRSARDRATKAGRVIGAEESIATPEALALYLGGAHAPGGDERRLIAGESADLCLLKMPLAEALASPDSACVAATVARGELIYAA